MRGWGFRRRNVQSKHNDPNLAYTLLADALLRIIKQQFKTIKNEY